MGTDSANRTPHRRGFLEAKQRVQDRRRDVRKVGAVIVVAGVALAGGVVAAAPVVPDPMPRMGDKRVGLFADKSRAQADRDGFVIRANLFGQDVRSVAPLGRALNSYQAVASLAGEAIIEFRDPKRPPKAKVRGATITVGASLGCAATPQQLQLGGTLSQAVNYSVTPSLSGTVGATAGGSGGSSGGEGNGSVNGSITPGISGTGGGTTTVSGTIQGSIAPGASKEFPLAKKALSGRSGYVVMRETTIRMDSCLGGSQLVFWAVATLSTDNGDVSTTAYGVPLFIKRDEQDPPVNPPKVRADPKPFIASATPDTAVAERVAGRPAKPAPVPAVKPAPAPAAAVKSAPAPAPAVTKPSASAAPVSAVKPSAGPRG